MQHTSCKMPRHPEIANDRAQPIGCGRWSLLLAMTIAMLAGNPLWAQTVEEIPWDTHESLAWQEVASIADTAPVRTWTPFAELLAWKLTEGSAENWAQEITPLGSGSLYGTASLVEAPFSWNAGLRVGLEIEHPAEEVQATLSYTYFGTTATAQAAGVVYSAFLGNFYADNPDGAAFGPNYRSADLDWDVQFHTLDLEFGKTLAISSALALRPYVGIKGAVIRQNIDSTWHDPIDSSSHTYLYSSATEKLKQDFWGLGPTLGIHAIAPISITPSHSVTAYFNPSATLMYGNWTFSDVFQTDGLTSTTILTPSTIAINSEDIHGAATMLRLSCGLQWEQPGRRVTTRLRLGYEAQVWLNQMQFYSYNMGRLNNLMSVQGGLLEIGLSF
ncbi:Lpg1974 family pore-forming outer membrane protein [Bremerella sp. JC817]|uniref:Lpg1974 family pore-forming outer membrane protein n=1 Tax=Bremerella sp. JC817 TaxID=3231756 RepID=UPI0034589BBF